MPHEDQASVQREIARRNFLLGVLFTGTATAATTYFLVPGGRASPSVTLDLVTGADPTGARELVVSTWNRSNPRTQIAVRQLNGSTSDQLQQMLTLARAGVADILNLDIINVPLFHAEGLIQPVELDPGRFVEKTLLASRLGSRDPGATCWAAPFNADAGMLFARGEPGSVLRGAGVPTLADVVDRATPGSLDIAGQLQPLSSGTYEAFVVNVLEHALSRDPEVLDENGVPSEDLAVWQNALEPLRAAVADGRLRPVDSEDATREQFQRQPLTYMRNWPVKYRELQQDGDEGVALPSVAVGPLPLGILGGQSLAITTSCVDAERANEVIAHLTDDTSQKVLAAYGLPAAAQAAYADRSLSAFIPHLDYVRGAVEQARPRPVSANYQAFADVLRRGAIGLLQDEEVLRTPFLDDLLATLQG